MLGLQNEREWNAFCKLVLLQPELAIDERFSSNARRTVNRDALCALIGQAFGSLSADQAIGRLEEAQIANAHVNDMHDVWKHPQLQARGRWTEVATPGGPIPALLPPGRTDAHAPRMDAVPGLGQHTDAILAELGWKPDDIAALRRENAV